MIEEVRSKQEQRMLQSWLSELQVEILPLTEDTGHRASVYMEEYAPKSSLEMADALIAATAVENRLPLCSGKARHYRSIAELNLKTFKP